MVGTAHPTITTITENRIHQSQSPLARRAGNPTAEALFPGREGWDKGWFVADRVTVLSVGEMAMNKQQLPVLIIAIFQGVVSAVGIILNLGWLLLAMGWAQVFSYDLTALTLALKGWIFLNLLLSVAGWVSAWGLGCLRRWGWVSSLVFQAFAILNQGLMARCRDTITLTNSVSMGILGAIALCLLSPPLRRTFAKTSVAIAQESSCEPLP